MLDTLTGRAVAEWLLSQAWDACGAAGQFIAAYPYHALGALVFGLLGMRVFYASLAGLTRTFAH